MKRLILAPAPLAPEGLAELKDWLGITTSETSSGGDANLISLLATALEACEAFTGLMPIACACEEVLPVAPGWLHLACRPVQAILGLFAIAGDGSRTALASTAYALDLGADGEGRVRLLAPATSDRIAVQFTAGLAASWSTLPAGLRQGIVRLAAELFRQRSTLSPLPLPPAAAAALWRPWRRIHLS